MKMKEDVLGNYFRIRHGYAFKGQYFTEEGTHIVVTPGNFYEKGGFRFVAEKAKYYSGDIPESFILQENDLIVAMTEQGPGLLGSSAFIPESNRFLHNQRIGLVTDLDTNGIAKAFLYYLFNTSRVRNQIAASASGTKVKHTAPNRIYAVRVQLPSITVQKRIASILSAYDGLIENNLRRIELLEDAARQVYKEWFVKLNFPGREHTKMVDGVPEGWTQKTFADICETIGGGTPSTTVPEYWEDGNIPWVTPTDITRNKCIVLTQTAKRITELGLKKCSARMLPPNTILMTSRASVGFFGVIDIEVCTNQGFISIIPHSSHHSAYLLYNLMNRVDEIRLRATGSTYKEISKSNFREMPIVLPSDTLLHSFQNNVRDMIQQIRLLKKQIDILEIAKSMLLPKLMSGEIAV